MKGETLIVLEIVLLLAHLPLSQSTTEQNIFVDSRCAITNSSCHTLDDALQNITSNSLLQLESGRHVVHSNYTISGKTNLSLIGDPADPSSVVIECDPSLGLIFMDIQELRMSGFTLTDCGFTGIERVLNLFALINNTVEFFFHPLYRFSSGLFLFNIRDLVMADAIITENEGFGMVAINIIGNSSFSRVDFTSNFPNADSVCNLDITIVPGGSGGGLFLTYHDYIDSIKNEQAENSTLVFEDGIIQDNYNCRRDPYLTQFSRLTKTLAPSFSNNMSIIGAGGITLSLGQTRFGFRGNFHNCTFINNTSLYYNAALDILMYNDTQKSEVIVQNSQFLRNGGMFYNPEGTFPGNGLDPFGALKVAFFIPLPKTIFNNSVCRPLPEPASVFIVNCSFVENTALSGAGMSVFSFTTTAGFINDMLTVQNCDFVNNTGNYGSAIFMTELSYSAFESALRITVDSVQVRGNRPLLGTLGSMQPFLSDILSAMDISNVRVSFKGNNSFSENIMTAVSTNNAVLEFSDYVMFSENSGVTGGAIHLERESYIVLVNQTELVFDRNTAMLSGGALYIEFSTIRASTYDCYLFFETIDIYCDVTDSCPLPSNRYTIRFFNNTAPLGSTIFGSFLSNCPWDTSNITLLNESSPFRYDPYPSLLTIIQDPPRNSLNETINTFPKRIVGLEQNYVTDNGTEVEVKPGQQFSITLSAYDQLFQPVPLTIFSQLNDPEAFSTIGTSNRLLLPGGEENFTIVPLRVYGNRGATYNVTITTNEVLLDAQFNVLVMLVNCSLGFIFNNSTLSCVCDIDQFLVDVTCNNDGSISFPENQWVGLDQDGNYIQGPCILDYCKINITRTNLSNPNSQCRNNRSGVLCGQCAEGYSRILGASFCDLCTDNSFLTLIVVFTAFGILLVVILALFRITITDGLINGFVFYANIFGVYTSTFLPVNEIRGTPAFTLISFLNLNFGIQSCFFDGMTELDLVGLTLVFPLYLMLILLVIALIGKWVTHERVSQFYQKINVTHIFATILLYSYASLMETCVAILAGLSTQVDKTKEVIRWGRDPNIRYGTGIHGLLVGISVVLLVLIIPLPIILLIPQISFRCRFLRNLKPIIDAFLAPFAPKKFFWVSFRLVFRVLIYLIAAIGVKSSTEQLVVIAVLITTMTVFQSYLKPFNLPSQNVIDTFLMLNLTLFSIVAIYIFDLPSTREEEAMTIMFIFMYFFCFLLLALFTHYALKRFECSSKPYQRVVDFLTDLPEKVRNYPSVLKEKKGSKIGSFAATNPATSNTEVTHTSIEIPSNALRETLLDEESPRTSNKNVSTRNRESVL